MTYKIVLLEQHIQELRRYLFDKPGVEGAAFVLCGSANSVDCKKLIGHVVVPVANEDYLRREPYGLTITSRALSRITKLAQHENLAIIFAHSHPDGITEFSSQDDREERILIPFLESRVPGHFHGTLVLTENSVAGRLYVPDRVAADVIEIGGQIRIWSAASRGDAMPAFDRQVRAFGNEIQRALSALHVGVVGLGGTGSPIAEQLCRLGIGQLTLFDGDKLELSNVNRVYGSSTSDVGQLKVEIAKRNIARIGLKTRIQTVPSHINFEDSAKILRECDIVFGCTDKQVPRAILTKLAIRYAIPVFDLGVLIDSDGGKILGVHGRVTTLLPGEACLFCRGRISTEAIRVETLPIGERESQAREGYAPELEDPAPAVISFTSAVASAAISELLHRLTGFMGEKRCSSEILFVFNENRIRTNRVEPRESCMCADIADWGRGDEEPYLGMMWPSRTK